MVYTTYIRRGIRARTYIIADDVGVGFHRHDPPDDLHFLLVVPKMFEYLAHPRVIPTSVYDELEDRPHRGLLQVLFLIGQSTIVFEPLHVFMQHEGEVAGVQALDVGLRLRAQAGGDLLGEQPLGQCR